MKILSRITVIIIIIIIIISIIHNTLSGFDDGALKWTFWSAEFDYSPDESSPLRTGHVF